MTRYVLNCFGSYGDVHPYVALALGLKARGHGAVVATSEWYRAKIEALGIEFAPVRPDQVEWSNIEGGMGRYMDLKKGTERILREIVLPQIKDSYADLHAATRSGDVLVIHPLALTGRLVAEVRGLKWASSQLSPIAFFSALDPCVLAPAPRMVKLRALGISPYRMLLKMIKLTALGWSRPWHRLRAEVGLPPIKEEPLFEGSHSPHLVLAMFSRHFAEKQADWPAQTLVTGFPFFDSDGDARLSPELETFLERGERPLVFTLGTAAVHDARDFYAVSLRVARKIGQRAVFLVGKDTGNELPGLTQGREIAVPYAPFSQLFHRASVVIHQGGVGTTAHALKSGRPMLVVPYSHDQPDNAARAVKLGAARTIPRKKYGDELVERELKALLEGKRYLAGAGRIAGFISAEDGVRNACDALEELAIRPVST